MSRKLFRITNNQSIEATTATIRELPADFVRVAPKAVAFNPTDWKHVQQRLAVGSGSGCDFAGIVTEVGSAVKDIKVGDQVFGAQAGASTTIKDNGAYSELVDIQADSVHPIPLNVTTDSRSEIPSGKVRSFEQAAGLGIAVGTVGMAVLDYKKEPFEKNSAKGWALVYGAGGSLGFITTQVFKWLGYDVIAVASEKHRANLKAAGIEHLVDYHDEDWPEQAKKIANDQIFYAYDTIAVDGTIHRVHEAVAPKGHIHLSLPVEDLPTGKDVTIDAPIWYFLWNLTYAIPGFPKGSEELLASRPKVVERVNELLRDDVLYSLPVRVYNGIDKTPEAMQYGMAGKVLGEKLVVRY